VDNQNNQFRYKENPVNNKGPNNPDPIIQARDESGKPEPNEPIAEVVLSAEKPTPITEVAPLSKRFIGIQDPEKPAQTVSNIIESILRFKWTILVVSIVVAAPLIAAIWTLIVPKYRARAEVRVRPIIPFLVFRTEDSGMIPLYSSFLNTQVSIIRGLTVLQRVLDRSEIQQTQWYRSPNKSPIEQLQGNPDTPMERLLDALNVRPRGRTEIIDVSFVTYNPKEAKLVVDTVLEQYIKYIGEMSDATGDKLYRQLTDLYKSLENEILGREKIIADLCKSLGTETPQDLVSSKRARLDEAEANLNKLRQRIAILEWRMKRAVTGDSNNVTTAFEDQIKSKYYEDAEWRELDINVRTLQHQIENSVYTDKNPNLIRAKKDLEFAEELLRMRESQLDEQWQKLPEENTSTLPSTANAGITGSKVVGSAEQQLEQLKHEEQLLVEDVSNKREEFEKLFETAQLFEKENNELLHKRDLFNSVQQRLDQKNMERNVPGSIEVLMWGFISSKPYNDRRTIFSAMAMAFGLCVGGGVAFLRAGKNQVVYSPQDILRPVQMPFLGYIPLVNLRKSLGKALSEDIKQKQFVLTESIRFMRTALLSRLDSHNSATVLITSSVTGTGKSSFTNTLGHSMAQAGKNVLMIDTDFHKTSLSEWYDLLDKPGFMNCLNAGSIDKQCIYQTETLGLSIMPAGGQSNGNTVFEEIAKGSFKTCIEQLRKQYQIILFDCSPILPVADATIMASQVDGTIFVERELVSHRGDIATAISRINSTGGRLFGFAFVGSVDYQKNMYTNYYYKPDRRS
jgi:succinoglycan biosynthesis transport protein ExoP